VDNVKDKDFFLKCCPNWDYVAVDSIGHSEGLISGWNLVIADLQAFQICVGILLEGRLKDITTLVKILNCYGPYKDMVSFR